MTGKLRRVLIAARFKPSRADRGCRITRDLHLSRQELYFDKISLFNCLPGKHSPEMMDCGL